MIGKRVQFDDETWQALDMLARDRMMNFQELADEAFADLLRKHDRPTDLKDALKRSVKERSNPREDKPARRAPRGRHD
jgi:non-homologous end joining protein Ku